MEGVEGAQEKSSMLPMMARGKTLSQGGGGGGGTKRRVVARGKTCSQGGPREE